MWVFSLRHFPYSNFDLFIVFLYQNDHGYCHCCHFSKFLFPHTEYLGQKKVFGGLLFLLPPIFNPDNIDIADEANQLHEEAALRDILVELEQLLIHSNIPVSEKLLFLSS